MTWRPLHYAQIFGLLAGWTFLVVALHTERPVCNVISIVYVFPTGGPTLETAEETDLSEAPARPKGRPKKSSIPPDAKHAKPFPEPPKSTIKDGTIPHERFFAYLKALPGQFSDRLIFFLYREWPSLDFLQHFTQEQLAEIKAKRRKAPVKYIAKYTSLDPADWRNQLLQRHGSGVYKIMLNDVGVRGNPNLKSGHICSTHVEIRDAEFLPIIEDLSVLNRSDPNNNSFINELRMKGINLPGDPPNGEQEDMAATVAVEKLTDALVEQSKLKVPDNSAAIMLSDLLKQSEARHLKELELAEARHVRDMEAINKRLEAAEATAKVPQNTTTKDVIEMARTLVPAAAPPADNGMVALLTQMLASADKRLESEKAQRIEELKMADARHAREMEAVNKRLEAQENRAIELEKARLQQAQVAPGKSAIKDAVDMFRALRGATDELSGDAPTGTGNPWVDLLAENLPKGLELAGHAITALQRPAASAPASAVPGQQPQQQTAIQQPQQENTEVNQMQMYARMIRGELVQALAQGVPGHRFAAMIVTRYPGGEQGYQFLSEGGEPRVMELLQAAPEVWGDVLKYQQRVPGFIAEFLDQASVMATVEAFRAGQGQRPTVATPPPAGRPGNQAAASAAVIDVMPAADVQQGSPGRVVIGADGKPIKTRPNGGVPENF